MATKKKKIQEVKIESGKNNFLKENKIVFIIIFAVAALVIVSLLVVRNINHFENNGLEFNKRVSGDLVLYTAKFPVKDYYGNIIEYRQVDFRTNPKELNKVRMDYNGTIKILDQDLTYISYGALNSCEYTTLAGANLGVFFSTIGIKYKAGIDDSDYINNTNSPYVNCRTNPFNTVIQIHSGNETRIAKLGDHCYDIQYKNCEILPAVEKFEVTMLEQYTSRL